MQWQPVYKAYPVNREFIWLNNCGTTPAGRHVLEAMTHFLQGYAARGVFTDAVSYRGVQADIKASLSRLLGCAPEELALIHHTAEGMNIISHGLSLAAGDEIVLLENEYPSNVYPWHHWQERGVRLVTTPMGDSPQAFWQALQDQVRIQTRVLALSAVHWCTGMPLPLDEIGAFCRERDIYLVVDGAQGVGMRPINVRSLGIDFMAFPAWKWLMGPLGVGVLYVARERLQDLRPVFVGTDSVVQSEVYLPYKTELKPDASRFTISTPNFNDWVYFKAALEFLAEIGFERVQERIGELGWRLAAGLQAAGLQVMSAQFADTPTGIIVCVSPKMDSSAIMRALKAHRIVAAERLGRVRFSPHIYISPAQIDQVVDLLAEIN